MKRPNATLQVRDVAGAGHERTLFPVTCKRLLGAELQAPFEEGLHTQRLTGKTMFESPIRHPRGHGNQRPVGSGCRVTGYVWFQPGFGLKPSIRSAFLVFMTLAFPLSSPRISTRPPKFRSINSTVGSRNRVVG